jgi:HEAT repeat protein
MQMDDPLTITYRLLANTGNSGATAVLARALDEGDGSVRPLAAAALAERRERLAHVELLRRFERLDGAARGVCLRHALRLSAAAADCLSDANPATRRAGLEFIRATDRYELLPALIDVINQRDAEVIAVDVFRELIDRLEAHCTPAREPRPPGYLRNSGQIRHDVLTHLDRACARFASLRHPEPIVEAVLTLGNVDDPAVAKVLTHGAAECRDAAGQLLVSSRHPAVMELIINALSRSHPSPLVLRALEQRDDPEFIRRLLAWLPAGLTEIQRRNLALVGPIVWLKPERLSDDFPPPELQPALVRLLTATGGVDDRKLAVQEWLIRNGTPEGRLAAAEVLPALAGTRVEKIVIGSLESQDESIQAWATGQLRSQGVAAALSLLIERLDSPLPAVRDAARRELAGFDLDRMLRLFQELDPTVCRRAAHLLRKIHPDCGDRLGLELRNPVVTRRLRAVRAADALGMQREVLPELLALSEDDDASVRRAVGEVLARLDGSEVMEALERLLTDDDGRVRRAVTEALERRRSRPAWETSESV